MYQEKIVNIESGEEIFRDYTQKEIDEIEKAKIRVAAEIKKESEMAAAKAVLLEKLGITEEEAKLLLS